MRVLVTGAGGLVGATAVDFYASRGESVWGIEDGTRERLLGNDGNTLANVEILKNRWPHAQFHHIDVLSKDAAELTVESDLVIHCAAQPSHPKSIEIPLEDARINIDGTLHLLEVLRRADRRDVPFVFCSTNKVYGDAPNRLRFRELELRYELVDLPQGIDESLPIDGVLHTPFGVSKAAADLYTQEYGMLYGLPTASFRMSCITGPFSRATVYQNWIAYFMLCALEDRPLGVYGFKGKQVRDNIDARDLVRAFDSFRRNPRPGEVYNLGGGPTNSVSCLETIQRIERMTGNRMRWSLKEGREADHRVYITNLGKFRSHYPDWDIKIGIERIFDDLFQWVREARSASVESGLPE